MESIDKIVFQRSFYWGLHDALLLASRGDVIVKEECVDTVQVDYSYCGYIAGHNKFVEIYQQKNTNWLLALAEASNHEKKFMEEAMGCAYEKVYRVHL